MRPPEVVYLANFTALLSINLGILNLLPIPALDGSRIIFAGIESLRGRPLEPEKENMIHFGLYIPDVTDRSRNL